jgi:hypothetical protein
MRRGEMSTILVAALVEDSSNDLDPAVSAASVERNRFIAPRRLWVAQCASLVAPYVASLMRR